MRDEAVVRCGGHRPTLAGASSVGLRLMKRRGCGVACGVAAL